MYVNASTCECNAFNLMRGVNPSAPILYCEVSVHEHCIQFASSQIFVAVIVDGSSKVEERRDRELFTRTN